MDVVFGAVPIVGAKSVNPLSGLDIKCSFCKSTYKAGDVWSGHCEFDDGGRLVYSVMACPQHKEISGAFNKFLEVGHE